MEFYPHTMTWNTPDGEATEDVNGYLVPGTPGEPRQAKCRFRSSSNKMVKNQDSTESLQVGKIRIASRYDVPHLWANVTVVNGSTQVYQGLVKTRSEGQLSAGWVEV